MEDIDKIKRDVLEVLAERDRLKEELEKAEKVICGDSKLIKGLLQEKAEAVKIAVQYIKKECRNCSFFDVKEYCLVPKIMPNNKNECHVITEQRQIEKLTGKPWSEVGR